VMKELHAAGKLNSVQSLFMAERKPDVEFYDLEKDPHEVVNLATGNRFDKEKKRLGGLLDRWMGDAGAGE
jgi:hypothetical protein